MKNFLGSKIFPVVIILSLLLSFFPQLGISATGSKVMVATADSHATRAALDVLKRGGNAIDAAIAAQWVLNVVEPQSSGIGGGGFILYYQASTKRIYAMDGREKAPGEAHPNMFLDEDGQPFPYKPERVSGGLPVGVPGVLKLLKEAHEKFSSRKLSFGELFLPAIQLAENGFPISERFAYFLNREQDRLKMFKASREIYFDKMGNPLPMGYVLRQVDLANTFKLIQKEGISVFYEGEIADDIVSAVRNAEFHPGVMKKEDLAEYRVVMRDALYGRYREHDIFSMSPPSSGGTTLIEALNILEQYDMPLFGTSVEGMHLLAEAQKLAFQDRDRYVGDPEFTKVPVDMLTSKEHAKSRAEEIELDRASVPLQIHSPSVTGMHTSHISIVDEYGNAVAFTTTIEDIFGSCLTVPGRGFLLNNELTDFDAVPRDGDGNLVPNAPEGDKRPRSSMTPTLVFKEGKLVLILGTPGGSTIIGSVLNVIVNMLDFKMPIDKALAAPRIINRNGPTEMEVQLFENEGLVRELERRGHQLGQINPFGNVQAIHYDADSQMWIGASDPRGEGESLGY